MPRNMTYGCFLSRRVQWDHKKLKNFVTELKKRTGEESSAEGGGGGHRKVAELKILVVQIEKMTLRTGEGKKNKQFFQQEDTRDLGSQGVVGGGSGQASNLRRHKKGR